MSPQPNSSALTHWHRAILRAVDAGRSEVLCGCAPDLLIDGRFCDYVATHELFRAGLIIAQPGPLGHPVAAWVTDAGRLILAAAR
jgi:hypothetical protein